jgi:hypothetical protein
MDDTKKEIVYPLDIKNPGLYKKEFCQKLIDHMSRGYSFESFGATLSPRVGRSTMYDWIKVHPEWKEAKEVGESAALGLLEKIAVAKARGQTLKDPEGNEVYNPKVADTTMNIFLLKTRFHTVYGEKKEIDLKSSDGSMTPAKKRDLSKLSDEELERLEELHSKIDGLDEEEGQ